jgi:hypothetical protein
MSSFTNKNLSSHILPASATMVGVCMTVISIVKLAHVGTAGMVIDKILAFDSVLFLLSAAFSYLSLRAEHDAAGRLEYFADGAFMVGLIFMVVAAFALSFELL